jgi:hypothetical protein
MARRGDLVLADVPEPSLGVCNGVRAVFVGSSGFISEPMRRALLAWRV